MIPIESLFAIPPLAAAAAGWWGLRRKGLDRWLPYYLATPGRRRPPAVDQPIHLLLCIADHFEPHLGGASDAVAFRRLGRWLDDYPKLFGDFRDSDGRPPRHTFFYPIEEYRGDILDPLADFCREGFGEVEIHLHHDNDTAENLRRTLLTARDVFSERHGLLARDRKSGEVKYGFIHGNWALDNSRPDGCWCGVNNELDILRETGCYADFTLPSAPNRAQTKTINSIYYAVDNPRRPKSHNTGVPVGKGPAPANSLMMIQGPLVLNWSRAKWGLIPRVENACLQGNQPATIERLPDWLRACVQVPTRPDWFFVKLHTHGANDDNMPALLGEPMVRFHRELSQMAATNPNFHYHYVTARELYNLAKAAEDNSLGDVASSRDNVLSSIAVLNMTSVAA